MGNVLLLLAYKYRKKVQHDVPDKFEKKLKQKNHPNSKMVKVQVVKREKSRISPQNNAEFKRKHEIYTENTE